MMLGSGRQGTIGMGGLACAVLSACTYPAPEYDGTTEAVLIHLEDSPEFTVFVRPRTAPRADAIRAAGTKAGPLCTRLTGRDSWDVVSAEDRNFATPFDWTIEGRCS